MFILNGGILGPFGNFKVLSASPTRAAPARAMAVVNSEADSRLLMRSHAPILHLLRALWLATALAVPIFVIFYTGGVLYRGGHTGVTASLSLGALPPFSALAFPVQFLDAACALVFPSAHQLHT